MAEGWRYLIRNVQPRFSVLSPNLNQSTHPFRSSPSTLELSPFSLVPRFPTSLILARSKRSCCSRPSHSCWSCCLEDERRLEDQQRIRLDELLDMVQDTDLEPREDIQAESSKPRFEETSNNTTVHINFKIRDGIIWKPVSTHLTERSESSEIEKVAMKWVREKWRLFNTELRMLAPQQCYDAAIVHGTYTILLMRESDISIDHEPLLSAMKIGIEAKEQVLNPRPQKDFKEIQNLTLRVA